MRHLPARTRVAFVVIAASLSLLALGHLAEAVGNLGIGSMSSIPPKLRGEVALASGCLRAAFRKHDRGVGARPTLEHSTADRVPRPFAAPQFSVPTFATVCAGRASCENVLPQLLDAFCDAPHEVPPAGHEHGVSAGRHSDASHRDEENVDGVRAAVGATRVVVVVHGPPGDTDDFDAAFRALAAMLPPKRFAVVRVPRALSCAEWFNAMLRAAFAGRAAAASGDAWTAAKALAAVRNEVPLAALTHPSEAAASQTAWAGLPHEGAVTVDGVFVFKAEAVPKSGHLASFARFAAAHDNDGDAGWLMDGFSAFGLRRAAFARLGFFDEGIFPASGEDDEYQMRAASLGLAFHDYTEQALVQDNAAFQAKVVGARRATWGRAIGTTTEGSTNAALPAPRSAAWDTLLPTLAYGVSAHQALLSWPANVMRCCAYAPPGEAMQRLDKVDYLWRKWGLDLRTTNAVASHRYTQLPAEQRLFAYPWNLTDVSHNACWGVDAVHRRCTMTGEGPRLRVRPAAVRFVEGKCLYSECEACLFDFAGVLPRLRGAAHRKEQLPNRLVTPNRQRY